MEQVLNKRSKEVAKESRLNVAKITFSNDRAILFSSGAVEMAKLVLGKYIHFVIINDKVWVFKCNDDDSGFKVCSVRGGANNVRIHAQGIIRIFKKKFPHHELPATFYVQYNQGAEHDGDPIYEILTHKVVPKHKVRKGGEW